VGPGGGRAAARPRREIPAWGWARLAPLLTVLLLPLTVRGNITSDQLFLAPSAVPTAVYDPPSLVDVPFSSGGGSTTFSIANVPGATQLLALHILPVLNPDPNNPVDGAYTPADLAAINVNNYQSYYSFTPNVDYFASNITNNASTVSFNGNADGSYYADLVTSNGSTTSNTYFRIQFGDFLAKDPNTDATGADRRFTLPQTDLTIISNEPNDDAMKNAMAQLPNAVKADTVQGVVDAIKNYYNTHGQKKFEVQLIGHGREGSIRIGNQRINNDGDQNGGMTPAQFQAAIDPYVSSIHFFSCSTGAGAEGTQFLKELVASIPTVTALSDYGTIAQTYFDVAATARVINGTDVVPEPYTLLSALFCSPVLICLASRRLARKTA
jgi:hypothetical protein